MKMRVKAFAGGFNLLAMHGTFPLRLSRGQAQFRGALRGRPGRCPRVTGGTAVSHVPCYGWRKDRIQSQIGLLL